MNQPHTLFNLLSVLPHSFTLLPQTPFPPLPPLPHYYVACLVLLGGPALLWSDSGGLQRGVLGETVQPGIVRMWVVDALRNLEYLGSSDNRQGKMEDLKRQLQTLLQSLPTATPSSFGTTWY